MCAHMYEHTRARMCVHVWDYMCVFVRLVCVLRFVCVISPAGVECMCVFVRVRLLCQCA